MVVQFQGTQFLIYNDARGIVSQEKKIPLRFLAAPLAFAFIFTLYFAFDYYLNMKEKQIRAEFEKSFPADRRIRKANDTANALPALAYSLGILIQPDRILTQTPEFAEKAAKFRKVWDELNHYVKAEAIAVGAPVAVPEETKQFLQISESSLKSVVEFLNDEDSPQWKEDPTVETNFIPVLIAVIRLHHTLAANSIYQLETNHASESEQTLFACWKLNESLQHRREPIAIIVAVKCSSMEIGLLKKLSGISPKWKERMHSIDYRTNLAEAMVLESGRFFDSLNEEAQRREFMTNKFSHLPDWVKGPAFAILDPYIRFSRVNYLSSEMDFLSDLRKGNSVKTARPEGLFGNYAHDFEMMETTISDFEQLRGKL